MTEQTQSMPQPFTFAEIPADVYIPGAALVSDDPATAQNAQTALQNSYAEAVVGVPADNILNDWPVDAEGNLVLSAEWDYHIAPRATGTFAGAAGRQAHHVLHCFATPSVAAIMASTAGQDFVESSILSTLKRRLSATMGGFLKSGDYSAPSSLREWIAGRESGASDNATRGGAKLFNAIAGDLAETLRKGVKGARIAKAEMRGLMASRVALADKLGLADKPEVEAQLADRLFAIARKSMLERATVDVAAWQAAPAYDEDGTAKPDAAPWPVNAETGKPDEASLAFYFRLLDTWQAERAEAVEETVEVDLSALDL